MDLNRTNLVSEKTDFGNTLTSLAKYIASVFLFQGGCKCKGGTKGN